MRWREPAATALTWVAEEEGAFAVECRPPPVSPATCELDLVSRGTARDVAARARAEAAIRHGYGLLRGWTPDASRRAEAEFETAHQDGQALDDASLQVDALLGLGMKHLLAGEIEESVAVLEEAHQHARDAGLRRRSVLTATRLASSLSALGEADRPRVLLSGAMDEALQIGFPLGVAEAHLGLGDVHYLTSELREAQREFERALDGYRRLANAARMIEAHLNLGYALADLSEDGLAQRHFERALELSRAEGDRRHEAIALRVLGNVHDKLAEGYRAIRYLEEARALFEDAEDRVSLVALNNGLGEVHAGLGDLAAALRYYRKAASLARSMAWRSAEGTALLEVASCQQRLGQTESAAGTYEEARGLFEAIGDSAMAASALGGLGGLHGASGRFDAAVRNLRRGLELMQAAGKARQSSTILLTLGKTYVAMGRMDPARDAAGEGLVLAGEAGDLVAEARALSLLARVARAEGSLEEARGFAERSLAVDESIRARVSGAQLRALFFEEVESRYSFYADLLMEMKESSPEEPFDRLAFESSERSRARVLLDSVRGTSSGRQVDEDLLEQEHELRERIRELALAEDLRAGESGSEDAAALDEMLAEHRRLQALVQSDSASGGGRGTTRWNLDALRKQLEGSKTLLVEYLLGAERSFVWVVSQDRFRAEVLPPRERIEETARTVYGLLTARQGDLGDTARERKRRADRQDTRFYEEASGLARILLGPIDDLDDFERLIVVTDGLLHYIPFSALPHPRALGGESTYQPLVASHEIVRAPSLSAVAAIRERSRDRATAGSNDQTGSARRVAILADPVFTLDDPRVGRAPPHQAPALTTARLALGATLRDSGKTLEALPRLLASRTEASTIARTAGSGATVATGFSAERSAAERVLGDAYSVVHFATHGILNDQHPELSAVVTSLVDEQGQLQDGFLRAQDVFGMHVGAEIVVLSACETALGKMLRGEGITGLVRAFLHAGADTVVASKWKVDDVATQELMAEFYRQLLMEGVDPASALREAQLKLFRGKASKPPFFWGAFEVHGIS